MLVDSSFLFVSSEIVIQETTEKGALIEATLMELNKTSESGNIYRIEEGEQIAKSLVGKPVFFGITWSGKHDNPISVKGIKKEPVGLVENTKKVGDKIKGLIRIIEVGLVEAIKSGAKFLFSVGGVAQYAKEVYEESGRKVRKLFNAVCNHLQMVPFGTKVGFPNAKLERVIEINETVLFDFVEKDIRKHLVLESIESDITNDPILDEELIFE